MSASETDIKTFTTLVRQLIMQYKDIKSENSELYAMVDERDKQIAELKEQLQQSNARYDAMMSAKMLNIADGDIEATRKRVNKLIRSVNQCITLLSDKEE